MYQILSWIMHTNTLLLQILPYTDKDNNNLIDNTTGIECNICFRSIKLDSARHSK